MSRFNLIDADRISIPRWTIQEDWRVSDCVDCGSETVRVSMDQRAYIFCSCQLLIEVLPR